MAEVEAVTALMLNSPQSVAILLAWFSCRLPTFFISGLAARNRSYDEQRLFPRDDRVRQRGVRGFMRKILLAREEPQEWPPLLRDVIADRPAQHRIAGFERVKYRALRGLALDLQLYLAADPRQPPQMWRQHDSNHGSVWTSTESTAGRSRTMGAQLSPASAEQ